MLTFQLLQITIGCSLGIEKTPFHCAGNEASEGVVVRTMWRALQLPQRTIQFYYWDQLYLQYVVY